MSTLSERIAERQKCAVVGCDRQRVEDSLFCREDLAEMWANRLDRRPDGTFVPRRRWSAKDFTGTVAL